MKSIVALLVLAAVASALTDAQEWGQFKRRFGRSYGSNEEEVRRFEIFKTNMRKAEALSAAEEDAKFGVTKFSDLTSEEFIAMYTGLNTTAHESFLSGLPKHIPTSRKLGTNWVEDGMVGGVKDQGSCGSCWAFAATCGLEGCYAIKYGTAKGHELSDQQMVDCCTAGGSDGCNGGWHDVCVEYAVKKNWATMTSYPYKGKKGTCKTPTTIGLKANTCKYYSNEGTEEAMQEALTHSVVPVALDASILQTYTGGVIKSSCTMMQRNHAVTLVADTATGDSYMVRNSWGTSWGEKGYFRMIKGQDCLGIADRTCVAY
jgi:hypothetical protein